MHTATTLVQLATIASAAGRTMALASRTVDNTRAMFEEWIGAYVREKHLTDYRAEIADAVIQMRMFS